MESGSSSLCMDTSRHTGVLALARRPRIHRYRANWVQRLPWSLANSFLPTYWHYYVLNISAINATLSKHILLYFIACTITQNFRYAPIVFGCKATPVILLWDVCVCSYLVETLEDKRSPSRLFRSITLRTSGTYKLRLKTAYRNTKTKHYPQKNRYTQHSKV